MTVWSDAGVRATALATRLVRRADLPSLARLDRTALVAALSQRGYLGPITEEPTTSEIELGLRRRAAEWLSLLVHWCGDRARALVGLLEENDRRAIRRMLRGAVQGASASERLTGLIPTPALPERALVLLSEAARPQDVAARLISLDSPYGAPLFPEVERTEPDLFLLELALDRTWAERALEAARDRHLSDHLRTTIDLLNADTALALAREREDRTIAANAFLEGGLRLDRESFMAALAAETEAQRRSILDAKLGEAPRTMRDRIRFEREHTRRDPSSTAPLIHYLLSLSAHLVDLGRIVWANALGAPPPLLDEGWVTP